MTELPNKSKGSSNTLFITFQHGAFVPSRPDTSNTDSLPTFDDTFSKPTLEEKPTISVIKNEYLMPSVEKDKLPMGPLSPQDILSMDIVFAGAENVDSGVEPSQAATPTGTVPITDESVISSDSNFIFIDCQSESIGKAKVKVEDDDEEDNEEDHVEAEQEDYDSNNESIDSLSMKELAVVESHSVDDPNNIIYEVYAVSTTGELSDKPLDLPPEVVEQIRISIGV